ncbi:hypothetical protein OSTOST_07571 [Ostertagia ostertagi]
MAIDKEETIEIDSTQPTVEELKPPTSKSIERLANLQGQPQSDAQIAVALRGLAIMKRNQILEQIVKPKEAKILAHFFEAEIPKPNQTVTSVQQQIVMLIDKAFGYGIEVLLMRPDLFEDVVDNELRLFLLDTSKAKRILLDCMLLHPEFVPIAWGGNILTKRQQDRQLQKQMEAKKAAEAKSRVEHERLRDASVPSPSKSFFDFLYNTFGESKESPKAAAPTKPAPNVTEKSAVKKSSESTLKSERSSIVEKPVKSREPVAEKSVRSETEESARPAWINDRGERVRRKSHKGKAPEKRIGERRRHT